MFITELSIKRPVVSLTKGAGHAVNQIKENLEWVESFPEVILCFDADEAGDKATKKVAELLSYGKCKIVQLPEKDPNELLMQNRQQISCKQSIMLNLINQRG